MMIFRRASVVAPVAGFLLGFLDFVWIKYVPFPFGGLGNSIAIWAVAAFLLTYGYRWAPGPAVAGAVTMLVLAVPSYYVAAALIQDDDWSNVWNINAWLWMALAVVAGVVFGAGGVVARRPGRLRLPALGLPAAVLFAEMWLHWSPVDYALVLAGLAVAVTVAVGRTWRDRALALAWAVPLGVAGSVLMRATAFGG